MLLILRRLAPNHALSFTELSASIRGIATNILSNRLHRLVSEGILTVTTTQSDRRKLLYSMTPKGTDTKPVLAAIELWSAKY